MIIIAHRGDASASEGNTLSAFRAAIEAGADMCEFDVHATRDGRLVVIHDETVDRTTNGRGRVAEMDFADLRRLAIKSQRGVVDHIPSLEEVFALTKGRLDFNIELKVSGIESQVCELMKAFDALDGSIVSSFDWKSLRRMREICPRVRIGVLAMRKAHRMLEAAAAMGALSVNPYHEMVDEELVDKAHRLGFKVYPWTVDAPERMSELIALGVDGIMTNYPRRLRDIARP